VSKRLGSPKGKADANVSPRPGDDQLPKV
jgi:hypothetical protein